jgi:hypothetical protein
MSLLAFFSLVHPWTDPKALQRNLIWLFLFCFGGDNEDER